MVSMRAIAHSRLAQKALYVAALSAGTRIDSLPAATPGVHYHIIELVLQNNHIAFLICLHHRESASE